MILIVEDNEDVRDLFQFVLESEGFTVATARSGREALAFLRSMVQTRLVLLDFALPDMTGLEVVEALKADRRLAKIPVLLVSGMPRADAGRLPMLTKPVAPEDLLAGVRCYAVAS